MPIEEKFSKDKFNIVSCGRISREKGMDLAVKACAKLVADGFDNIKWWIVGGGPAEAEVRNLISELNMENYVVMVGMKSNPYPYIKQADLYVQPSLVESFGLTIKEAMMLDRPIIATYTNGAKEIITHKLNGRLCSATDGLLALEVKKILETPNELKKIKPNISAGTLKKENDKLMKQLEMIF